MEIYNDRINFDILSKIYNPNNEIDVELLVTIDGIKQITVSTKAQTFNAIPGAINERLRALFVEIQEKEQPVVEDKIYKESEVINLLVIKGLLKLNEKAATLVECFDTIKSKLPK